MKSSSDGAMAERAKARFDADLQRLMDSRHGGLPPTLEACAAPLGDAGSGQQREQGRHTGVDSFPVPLVASAADQAPASYAALRTQQGSARRARRPRSIPSVSKMFIQAVQSSQSSQTRGDQTSGLPTPTPSKELSRNDAATSSKSGDGGSSLTVSCPPSMDAWSPADAGEASSICGGKNSTAEFGKKYAVLRVKVKRSYRMRRMEVRRQLDEKLWSREVPYVPKAQARSLDVEEVPQKAQTPSMVRSLEMAPWENAEDTMAFRSIKGESPDTKVLPDPEDEESCMNAFWCLWILGFIFPPLWLAGATGVLSSSRCGFIAGMTNVMTLMVAGITIAIFTV